MTQRGRHKDYHAFKGFESWLHRLLMSMKMHLYLLCASAGVYFVIVLVIGGHNVRKFFSGSWIEIWASVGDDLLRALFQVDLASLDRLTGQIINISNIYIAPEFIAAASTWWPLPIVLYVGCVMYFSKLSKELTSDKHLRGSELIESARLRTMTTGKGDIPLGGVYLPAEAETKHVFACGRTGAGKTVALSSVIEQLRARGEKAVIYDTKGDFASYFYDSKTDMIFNPLDLRGGGWTVANEIESVMDIDAIAASLIPPAMQADPFWNDAARAVFGGLLHYLHGEGRITNSDIWEAVTAESAQIAERLKTVRGGRKGYVFVQDASGKQALSVLATMMQYAGAFEYMSSSDGEFSIRKWLSNGKPGFIFITSYEDIKDTLRPILSLFVDLLGRKLLSLQDDRERRVFFILDEFGTLQRLSSIVNLLTLSRSKGGSVWIGVQDVGRIAKIYGRELRETILGNCGSSVSFGVGDPDTADYISRKLGEAETLEVEENSTMGVEAYRDGLSLSRRRATRKIVLPSEILGLPDLRAYVKLAGYDPTLTDFQIKQRDAKNSAFIMKPGFSLKSGE